MISMSPSVASLSCCSVSSAIVSTLWRWTCSVPAYCSAIEYSDPVKPPIPPPTIGEEERVGSLTRDWF